MKEAMEKQGKEMKEAIEKLEKKITALPLFRYPAQRVNEDPLSMVERLCSYPNNSDILSPISVGQSQFPIADTLS